MASAIRNYKEVEKVIIEQVKDTVTLILTQEEVNVLYKMTGLTGGHPNGNRKYSANIREALQPHVTEHINGCGEITLY